ncbi:hypothetical protein D1007_19288 [Hordeum vulgare]|nr:hypothetical protein D1007_19288 [Hordeum vulgare]
MESDGVFSQRFGAKRLREIAKSKLNPTKRKFIDETGFGDLKRIFSFTIPHDLMEWLEMNIDTGKRGLRLNRNKCDLRNIYHKNGRAPIAHTVDVFHKARNDDGDTTKRSWVLLALTTILTPGTGNMVPLEYLKTLEVIEKVTEYAWDEHVLSVAMNEFRPLSETAYAALSLEDGNTRVVVGNRSAAAQDVDCDDTQDCGASHVNINGNKGDIGAKENHIEDINPMENGKSAEEDVCGSLDDWLQNPTPFGVELEHRTKPRHGEEKTRLKEEKKFKSKNRAASPISSGAKYKKIKTGDKTKAMYEYFVMKRYKMNKMKKGEIDFDCGYFGVLYFEIFDGKRMKDFKKQNMFDVRKYLSSKLFYHPLNKVSCGDVHTAIVAA